MNSRWIYEDGTHWCMHCGFGICDNASMGGGDSTGYPVFVDGFNRASKERRMWYLGWGEFNHLMNYCPNCGAKMVKEGD